MKLVVLDEMLRVENTGRPRGTRSWKGWEPMSYSNIKTP